MMRRCTAFHASLLLLFAPLCADAADWQVSSAESSLRFTGEAQGEPFEGRFVRFEPAIRFDPAQLDSASFDVSIDLASVDSQNEERDATLADEDFFNTDDFPQARFLATEFSASDNGRYQAHGTLSLRGTDKPVTLDFSWSETPTGARLQGRATLDRMQFGVGSGEWDDAGTIAHQVRVSTTLVLVPTSEPSPAPASE